VSVVARFYVSEIVRRAYDTQAMSVTLQAVGRGPENAEWAAATPVGQLTMTIKNSKAAEFFEPLLGKDVQLLISEAPAAE
jgi:hypothetical protein